MAISGLTQLLLCDEFSLNKNRPQNRVETKCKQSVFGRAVYRITYPVRQLASSLLLLPLVWTVGASMHVWSALTESHCNLAVKVALTALSGVCVLVDSLTIGVVLTSTVGLIWSIGKAACEPRIDEMDTIFERLINDAVTQNRL